MERQEVEPIYSWLGDLDSTLNSPEGTKALESYLIHSDTMSVLEFIWACDGMKNLVQETPSKAEDLVTCIYKNYIMSGSLPVLSDEVVANIARHFDEHFERSEPSDVANQLKTVPLDLEIFENAKVEVETYLRMNIFPQFQKAVKDGKIYVSATNGSCNNTIRTTNGYQHQVEASNRTSSSRLASHPEAFAQTLCEKLEDLMRNRDSKPL